MRVLHYDKIFTFIWKDLCPYFFVCTGEMIGALSIPIGNGVNILQRVASIRMLQQSDVIQKSSSYALRSKVQFSSPCVCLFIQVYGPHVLHNFFVFIVSFAMERVRTVVIFYYLPHSLKGTIMQISKETGETQSLVIEILVFVLALILMDHGNVLAHYYRLQLFPDQSTRKISHLKFLLRMGESMQY